MYIYTYIHMYMYIYMYICIHSYIHMYIYIYMYMCIHSYIHIHIYLRWWSRMYRTGERKAVREMAFARGNLSPSRHFKLSQTYYLTVFSGLFSEFFVKETRFNLTSNSVLTLPVSPSDTCHFTSCCIYAHTYIRYWY
jgi:hypothetical protein